MRTQVRRNRQAKWTGSDNGNFRRSIHGIFGIEWAEMPAILSFPRMVLARCALFLTIVIRGNPRRVKKFTHHIDIDIAVPDR
ncbi:MAG: hypothetical protein ACYDC8_16675 [Gammaproteobacteria bacterium]